MKTVLRIFNKDSEYVDIPNPYKMIPRKDDYIVYKETSYTVIYVEFDFDSSTLFIVV